MFVTNDYPCNDYRVINVQHFTLEKPEKVRVNPQENTFLKSTLNFDKINIHRLKIFSEIEVTFLLFKEDIYCFM